MVRTESIGIGFLGLGTVGQGVWKHIEANRSALEARMAVRLELVRAGVRNPRKRRGLKIPAGRLTSDLAAVVEDPRVQIVCELMGGMDEALKWTRRAFQLGKTVVTANKALICEHGESLFREARENGGHYFFEASVAGGIPVIKAIQEGLVANRFPLIFGILNGTSNYILTRMEREGLPFTAILSDARRLGYVEADEALDLDGVDAAHKTAILTYLAHGKWVHPKEMIMDGIRRIALEDLEMARELGYRIKLIASIRQVGTQKRLAVSVTPCLLLAKEVVAGVDDVYNAVSIHGDIAGRTILIGRGAGQDATASSVISDIADAVKVLLGHPMREETSPPPIRCPRELARLEEITGRFYLRLRVKDQPGVLARITQVFGQAQVSLATVNQKPKDGEGVAHLFLTTHQTNELRMAETVKGLRKLRTIILDEPVLFRVFEP